VKLRSILYTVYGISLVVALAAPAAAQGVDDVTRAKAQLEAAGVSVATPCGVTMLTNLVAWNLRGVGQPAFGLLHKEIGHRAVLKADGSCIDGDVTRDPDGVATDYIIERASGDGWDILTSWLAPSWQGPETVFTARNWADFRDPLDPAPYLRGAPPAPATIPPAAAPPSAPPIVVLPSAPACDLSGLQLQIGQLAAGFTEHARATGDGLASINQNVTDGRNEARPAIQALKTVATWTSKYVLPAVGGWLAAKRVG